MGSIEAACIAGFLCRLCSEMHRTVIHIYGEQGQKHGLAQKINEYLPVTVSPTDPLPKTICETCMTRVEQHHDLMLKMAKTRAHFARLRGQVTLLRNEITQTEEFLSSNLSPTISATTSGTVSTAATRNTATRRTLRGRRGIEVPDPFARPRIINVQRGEAPPQRIINHVLRQIVEDNDDAEEPSNNDSREDNNVDEDDDDDEDEDDDEEDQEVEEYQDEQDVSSDIENANLSDDDAAEENSQQSLHSEIQQFPNLSSNSSDDQTQGIHS